MTLFKRHSLVFMLLLFLMTLHNLCAQSEEQKSLEAQREELQNEIRDINQLLFAEKRERGSVLDHMAALDKKISVRQRLIKVTTEQSNFLNRKISANISEISELNEELKLLKDEYGIMIQKSYQNRSQQSKLMFLLSADNFFQAFKRLQYIEQYTAYRREQGEAIGIKTETLSRLNKDLNEERKVKVVLLAQNQKAKNQLFKEIQSQKALLKTIRKNEKQYRAEIVSKRKEAKKIEKQIEKLIRSAIATANKSKENKEASSSKFDLTPEAVIVADNFVASKGNLIWPVEKGIKSQGFGVYSDPVYPGIKHESNGVIITVNEGAKARAIFEGEVIAILSVPGGNKGVQIKHGNFISTYYNLSELFVQKGESVNIKTELGVIYTNSSNGQTRLKFYLYEDTSKLNPEEWVYQL